jgi:trk system potassium uptake protein TrkA
MRVVFIGASSLAVLTAKLMRERGDEVVIIEHDKDHIDALTEELDCGFLHGDGSKPAILREADPNGTDVLFALTDNDQANILASLVGRSLGFKRVVTKIQDAELEHICKELGLEDIIVPSRTIGRFLAERYGTKEK